MVFGVLEPAEQQPAASVRGDCSYDGEDGPHTGLAPGTAKVTQCFCVTCVRSLTSSMFVCFSAGRYLFSCSVCSQAGAALTVGVSACMPVFLAPKCRSTESFIYLTIYTSISGCSMSRLGCLSLRLETACAFGRWGCCKRAAAGARDQRSLHLAATCTPHTQAAACSQRAFQHIA